MSLDASAADAWALLTTWGRYPEWFGDALAASGPTGPAVAGDRIVLELPDENARTVAIVAIDAGARALHLRDDDGPVVVDYRYTVTAESAGAGARSLLTLAVDCTMAGPAAAFGPLYRWFLIRPERKQLGRFASLSARR